MVGSLRVAMDSLELVSSTSSVEVFGEITRERKPPEEIQEVLVSLSYLPSAERLTVLMMKARNLFPQQVEYRYIASIIRAFFSLLNCLMSPLA